MKNIFKITLLAFTAILLSNCESLELDLLDNPNDLAPEAADANFILNAVQLDFNGVMSGFNAASNGVIRQRYQFGTYNNAVDNGTLTFEWETSYNLAANVDALETLSNSTENGLPYQLGVGQLLKAYAFVTLVDYVGDIPLTEANQPADFPNPTVDSGSDVYRDMFILVDEALANLSTANAPALLSDLYFDGNIDNWIALGNTLKIKMYNQTRLVSPAASTAGINQVLSSENFIDESAEDFQFQYSTEQNLVESRHPFFQGNWQPGGSGAYMSNQLYDFMNVGDANAPFIENGIVDPRTRYYFYRQTTDEPSGSNLPCEGSSSHDFCYVGNLYWGRDHGDEEGIPNDGLRRTTYGIYPGGGAFDRNVFVQTTDNTESLEGAGIAPLLLSSYTNFILAEASLTLGTSGSAIGYLESGIRQSFDKVTSFGSPITVDPVDDTINYAATSTEINDYVSRVLSEYNGASANGRLEIIAREYYIAAYGNGIEPYIAYKRTGFPNFMSPIIAAGPFPRSYQYPADEINVNPNIDQNLINQTVFWDNNPDNFID